MANPLVDIVIPIYGHADLVEGCIGRMASTTSVPYRLTLIDDKSPDPAVQVYLKGKAKVANLMHNFQNMGFGQTVNKAVRATTAPYVMILNSDTEPLPGWLDVMVDCLEANPTVGLVGPLLLFHPNSPNGPGGRVQHAGVYFDTERVPHHRFLGWPADHPLVREYRDDFQAITGACMLIRRSVWNQVGGFAKEYGLGTFEDTELSIQTKIRGHKIAYTPDAMLYHYVGVSGTDHGGFPLQVNYRVFMQRVGGVVEYDEWKLLGPKLTV